MKCRHLFIILLLGLCSIARGQTSYYWFDGQFDSRASSGISNGTITVDASTLSPGFHTLHYLYRTNKGVESPTYSRSFYVPRQTKGVKGEYWFDNDFAGRTASTTLNGSITIDASSLSMGFHTLNYFQTDADGTMSTIYSQAFFVQKQIKAAKGEYWFDGDYANRRELALSTEAVSIDLTELSGGLHALHYQALTAEGTPSTVYTKLFWVNGGAPEVASYHYWVNDLKDSLKSVTLETPTLPWKLVTSFDVPEVPIRTQKFHFEVVDDGTHPMVYAKNTLNLVIAGTDGSSTRIEQDYVDYRVGEQVYGKLLAPGEQRTVDITGYLQWFRVSVTRGDSIAFRTNRNCTMHLFSPTGEQLWEVSGDAAKKYNGTRAAQSGSYYMVVHDVTDSGVSDVMVTYFWEGTPLQKGDVNADGSVGIGDIVAVTNVMAGIENDAAIVARADVNADGSVGIGDIVAITNIMAGNAAARQQ